MSLLRFPVFAVIPTEPLYARRLSSCRKPLSPYDAGSSNAAAEVGSETGYRDTGVLGYDGTNMISRKPGSTGGDYGLPALRTPGPSGFNDAADPNVSHGLGHTAGPLGVGDDADPSTHAQYSLGVRSLNTSLCFDRDLFLWDYDPHKFLDNKCLNTDFARVAHAELKAAVSSGFRVRVQEAYRSPERSDRLHAAYKKGTGPKAAAGWESVHNYGLGMDVLLFDKKHKIVKSDGEYKKLSKLLYSFAWGVPGDSGHFEYHPKWRHPAKGKFLISVRDWAINAAIAEITNKGEGLFATIGLVSVPKTDFGREADERWLNCFWWAAGAIRTTSVPANYLSTNPPPTQHG